MARRALAMASTASSFMGEAVGTGRREVPSSPDFPWMSGAWTAGRVSEDAAPG